VGVAAADDESEQGVGVGEGGFRVHEDGVDVAFEMVDGDERFVGGEGERFGEGDADEQCAGEAGAFGYSYGVEIFVGDAGAVHGFADDRGDGAQVLAGGQLGDYAAVVGVDELRGDHVGERFAAVADHGGGGLVAGAFDAEDEAVRHTSILVAG